VVRICRAVRITCVWAMALVVLSVVPARNTALRITIVAGEGEKYSEGAHANKPLVIQVTDGSGQPVEGARVSFQLPEDGPGGTFLNGLRTDLAITDANGRANIRGLQINRIPGQFTIRITAAKEQVRAGVVVNQFVQSIQNATGAVQLKPAQRSAKSSTATVGPAKTAASLPSSKREAASLAGGVGAPQNPARTATITITDNSARHVVKASAGHSSHKNSHKKWIWLGILAAGGAAGAFAGSNAGAPSATHGPAAGATPSVSIGTPTVNIGKP
jgi:hypothetical protein